VKNTDMMDLTRLSSLLLIFCCFSASNAAGKTGSTSARCVEERARLDTDTREYFNKVILWYYLSILNQMFEDTVALMRETELMCVALGGGPFTNRRQCREMLFI